MPQLNFYMFTMHLILGIIKISVRKEDKKKPQQTKLEIAAKHPWVVNVASKLLPYLNFSPVDN